MESSLFDSDDSITPSSSSPASSHPAPPSGGILVLDKHIVYASLHKPLSTWLRRDVIPFVVTLVLLVGTALPALWWEAQAAWIRSGEEISEETGTDDEATKLIGGLNDTNELSSNITKPLSEVELQIQALYVPEMYHFWMMYLIPLYFFLSGIIWLVLYWNVKLQILLRYRNIPSIRSISSASHIRIQPVSHGGKSEICIIQSATIPSAPLDAPKETFFMFQKTKYVLHTSSTLKKDSNLPEGHVDSWFAPVDFPTHLKLEEYVSRTNSKSCNTLEEITKLQHKYGSNIFDIPLPPFEDLFKEHALAPFFVFQIFCVGLWCLDEYWYYSIVTLCMLVLFEATVVKRRLKSLEFLRDMRIKPYPVQVWRSGKWQPIQTSELVPHDIISIVRPMNEQNVVPADILLLNGTVVVNEAMLTGESIPVQKENIIMSCDRMDIHLELNKDHKRNMIFGGTKILLNNPPNAGDSTTGIDIKTPPDGGCIGYVIRTGFNTSQGKLVRTILFSSETVNINNLESLLFIGVLLIFAIAASTYVCLKGLEDETRSRYKLLLNSIMIITSVVPPELPMELSLAVNTSLIALMKQHIFCTEPFRIPLAGAVDICCFDKTGTLTADEFIVKGIAGVKPASEAASSSSSASPSNDTISPPLSVDGLLTDPSTVPLASKYVIAGCHSLTFLPESALKADDSPSDAIIGDPLEKSALTFIDWNIGRSETATSKSGKERLRLLHKYPFSSTLKRMSSIISLEHESGAPLRGVTKGAAEVMEHMFLQETLPQDFVKIHTSFAQQGCRVLALGWKELSVEDESSPEGGRRTLRDLPEDRRLLKSLKREDIESNLIFGGFIVLQCPLKKDSREVILALRASTHQVMMISGDHALTCCHVAMETGITTKPTAILQMKTNGTNGIEWQKNMIDDVSKIPFEMSYTPSSLRTLTDMYDLCVTGDALEYLTHTLTGSAVTKDEKSRATSKIALFISHVRIFSRASPEQKELIVHWLKLRNFTTLMCGDGTNDAGGLKQAHIGVALIGEDAAKAASKKKTLQPAKTTPLTFSQQIAKIRQQQAQLKAAGGTSAEQKAKMQQALKDEMKKMQEEMSQEENTTPRLGDASIAAPFTSKLPYITSCVDIIRQGRCTLVTTLQMFHILGVNCLMSAYSMSVLYLDGVKWGDTQMTISALTMAMFFLFVSRSEPLKQLSSERPHKNLFTFGMILSVLGQFGIHMATLLTAINSANPFTDDEHRIIGKTFQPNVLNTVVFLISITQTVATFAANYRGRPFMGSLSENVGLYKSLVFTFGLMMLLASESIPSLNTFLELHPLPSPEFRSELIGLLLIDVGISYVYAKLIRRIFANNPTAEQIRACGGQTQQQLAAVATIKKTQ